MSLTFITFILILISNIIYARIDLQNHVKTLAKPIEKLSYSTQSDHFTHISPSEMIKRENYTSETHKITTEDGYILTVYRIPGRPNSTPVFLQHGLLESSADWLHPGRGKSLAFILSDYGYDVWLGNARGTTYSKSHQNLSTADPKYWNFSWEELGMYDLPAVINYITNLKQGRLFYIGHSMGATTFSVMAIERPDVAKKVKAMIALAPATYAYHMRNPLKLVAPFWNVVELIANSLGIHELLPRNKIFDYFVSKIDRSLLINHLSRDLLFFIAGFNEAKFDSSLLSRIYSHFPAGTSVKLFIHFMQQVNVNTFRKFDYGSQKNLRLYHTSKPPRYDLSKVDVPVAVFWSVNDRIIGPKDAEQFYNQVPRKAGLFKVNDTKYSHFDFLWAVDAPQLVYSQVLDIMMKCENSNITK